MSETPAHWKATGNIQSGLTYKMYCKYEALADKAIDILHEKLTNFELVEHNFITREISFNTKSSRDEIIEVIKANFPNTIDMVETLNLYDLYKVEFVRLEPLFNVERVEENKPVEL